jgi:hypothetical protein
MTAVGKVISGEDDEEDMPRDKGLTFDQQFRRDIESDATQSTGAAVNAKENSDKPTTAAPNAALPSDKKSASLQRTAQSAAKTVALSRESPMVKELRTKNAKFQKTIVQTTSQRLDHVQQSLQHTNELFEKTLHTVKDVSYNVRLANVDLEELFTRMTESLSALSSFHSDKETPQQAQSSSDNVVHHDSDDLP